MADARTVQDSRDDATTNTHDYTIDFSPLSLNWLRASQVVEAATDALRQVVEEGATTFHDTLLATLGSHPVCQVHTRKPGDPSIKLSALKGCSDCQPWLSALGAAHASGNQNKLNATYLYPGQWRDRKHGSWNIAMAFTRGSKRAASPAHADTTCIANILLHFKGAYPALSNEDRDNLCQLRLVRNEMAHLKTKKLSDTIMHEYIAHCLVLLHSGPWTKPPFKEATRKAIERIQGWRDDPGKLLPPLEQLPPHYVPQESVLEDLHQRINSARGSALPVVALSGIGGVGKSTTALAAAHCEVRNSNCLGLHGVLWGNAQDGLHAAFVDIVTRQLRMHLEASEAADPAIVRQRLQGWAMGRDKPWLLVLDNVPPDTEMKQWQALLREQGVALITSRSSPNSLYRGTGIERAAVQELQCLNPDEGYKLMAGRVLAAMAAGATLPTDEQVACRQLAGPSALGGLPLALQQAAGLVATQPSQDAKSFKKFLHEFTQLATVAGTARSLPGDDSGRAALWRDYTSVLQDCGLEAEPALLNFCMEQQPDGVALVDADAGQWGAGKPPSTDQRRKWREFQRLWKDRRAATVAPHTKTVATLWKAQLARLPEHCVELLRVAACCAPDHVPQRLLALVVQRWAELAATARDDTSNDSSLAWLAAYAQTSALVGEVEALRDSGRRVGVDVLAREVVESTLARLEEVCLVHRGSWGSVARVHAKLSQGAFATAVGGASGGAGAGAGAGGPAVTTDVPQDWFSMHRLVQGAVLGGEEDVEAGLHAWASLRADLIGAVAGVKAVLDGEATAMGVNDMALPVWLVEHSHASRMATCVCDVWRCKLTAADDMDVGVEKVAQFVNTTAALAQVVPLMDSFGHAEELVQALQVGVNLMRHLQAGSGDLARAVAALVVLRKACGQYVQAAVWGAEVVALWQQVHGDADSSDVAGALNNLADLYRDQSRYDEAEPLLVRALAMEQRLHGDSDNSAVASALNNLAVVYQDQSRSDEAEPLYVQALAMQQRLHGDSDSSDVAGALNNLAMLHRAQSRCDKAEPLFEQALAMQQRLHGDSDSSDVARALNNLALLYKAQSRYDEAEPLYVQALAMERRLHGGSDSSDVARAMNNLACLYQAQSRYDEAEPLLKQALEIRQRVHGCDSALVFALQVNLAQLYMGRKPSNADKAKPLVERALENARRRAGGSDGDSDDVCSALQLTARVLELRLQFREALLTTVQWLDMKRRLRSASVGERVVRGLLRGLLRLPQPAFVTALIVAVASAGLLPAHTKLVYRTWWSAIHLLRRAWRGGGFWRLVLKSVAACACCVGASTATVGLCMHMLFTILFSLLGMMFLLTVVSDTVGSPTA